MTVVLDKIASSSANVALQKEVRLTDEIPAVAGTVVVVRVLDDKDTYNQVEDVHGRMMLVQRGDVLAGVLGSRRALRGYTGDVPSSVHVGDVLHLLNTGGVIGLCIGGCPEVGPPARVQVLGAVARKGVPLSIVPGPIPLAAGLHPDVPPLVLVAGTCMNAGKTRAACAIVRHASRCGLRVGACKVTGVALRADTLRLKDHGAFATANFADVGLPSTCDAASVVAAARGCINAVGARADLVVVELGDGLMGDYGVSDVLADEGIHQKAAAVVLAALDPVGAWGGVQLLRSLGYETAVVTGPATDNPAGIDAILQRAGVAAINAADGLALTRQVLDRAGLEMQPQLQVMASPWA